MSRSIIGIDEAGRGPLAGPVTVGVCMVPHDFDWALVSGARDSKQLTELARERVYARMCELCDRGSLQFSVAFADATVIDAHGIVPAIQSALSYALADILCETSDTVLLDGGLKAPVSYINQKTIIRGDETEPIISLASIAAKVERDHLMEELAHQYPQYGFEKHKGYGTTAHRAAIQQHGLSPVHRTTFYDRN